MPRTFTRALLPLALLLLGTVVPAMGQAAMSQNVPVLRPGDRVNIAVWQMPDMSGEFSVRVDGTLEHPRYNQVQVAGPVDEAEQQLEAFLRRLDQNVEFTMQPQFRVFVGGEVRAPDLYHHTPDVTIAQAVTLAGGATERGHLGRVRLIREGRTAFLDLRDPSSEAARTPIRSGDELIVSRRRSTFRDYILPAATVISAVTGVIRVLRYN